MEHQLGFSRKRVRSISFIGIGLIGSAFLTMFTLYFFSIDPGFYVILLTCSVGFISCGLLVGVLIYSRGKLDIVDHKLLESKERYKMIISASHTGAWEYHSDTHHQWCSPEYFHMLGYEESDFMKDNKLRIDDVWKQVLHPDDREAAIGNFEHYLSNGSQGIYQNYFRLLHKNGNWLWIWSRGQTLRNPDGTLSTITLGTHIDVTEKKLLEIELLKHNKKLLKYAYLNAHKVRGPVARLLGLIEVSNLDTDSDYRWFFEKIKDETISIDKVLKVITEELDEKEEHKRIKEELNEETDW